MISFNRRSHSFWKFSESKRELILRTCLLSILWNWFLIELSVLPGISLAIWAHLFPYFLWSTKIFTSSSTVIGSLFNIGVKMIMPSFSSLFGRSSFYRVLLLHHIGNCRPLLNAKLSYKRNDCIVFFFQPVFTFRSSWTYRNILITPNSTHPNPKFTI